MMLSRRGLITGLAACVAAPSIVRASSLMPIKALGPTAWDIVYVKRLHKLLDQTYKDLPSWRFPGDGWECLKKDGLYWGMGQEFVALMDEYRPVSYFEVFSKTGAGPILGMKNRLEAECDFVAGGYRMRVPR